MTDDQILDAIKTVCGFDGSEVERWRAEALMIGRAVEQAARREVLEHAANVCLIVEPDAATRKALGDAAHYVACANAIRALADGDKQ